MERKNDGNVFVKNWLNEFTWLAYSKLYDGAFCIPCVFVGLSTGHNCGKLNSLYKSPQTFWTSAHSKLKARVSERCKMHQCCCSHGKLYVDKTRRSHCDQYQVISGAK